VVILFTFSTANTLAFWVWDHVAHDLVFSVTDNAPHTLRIILGLATFSIFYTTFITAFFTCAVSADTLAELEGRKVSLLHGLGSVLKRFFRVAHFAILAIFFFPIALFVQHRKLKSPRGFIDVIGSSLSLNMSQLAPAILTTQKSVSETIRDSINTLGRYWRESLILKIGMYISIFLIGLLGFLPKVIERKWFDGETAHVMGWLASVLLWLMGYVAVKIIGNVFTSVLYFKAKSE
jgi:hypothetical protein